MRIAYFNANLKVGQDGVTRVVYKMIDGALERGYEAIAVASVLPEPSEQIIPMYKVPSMVIPLQKAYRMALPGYQSFARELHEFKPDIIHINSPCTLGFGAVKYAKHFGVPVIATYHTHFPTYPRYYSLTKLEDLVWRITRNLYNSVDRTLVPTKPILDELTENNIQRLQYLPNGVDTGLFTPERRNNAWRTRFGSGSKPIILFVSRLVWEKDLRVLAKTYQQLRTKRNDFEMVIVGDGNARTEFEQMMPGAHFLGYQTGVTLAESFASADIFVFPSTTETFGLVTLEAMASGLTPVAAKMGGAIEIIEEGTSGLHAKPLDSADLAHKVEWLLDHPNYSRTMGEQAHRRAQEYRWESILSRLFTTYEDVLQEIKQRRLLRKAA
ncbi:MAG: glycosyltransferase family 1 protein [Ignavibacteriae bacterium]|nr:MAG: glycosyltransferase family 1 protein [Ignavibacteriota bacterium]